MIAAVAASDDPGRTSMQPKRFNARLSGSGQVMTEAPGGVLAAGVRPRHPRQAEGVV
jgi:hypothetical protein